MTDRAEQRAQERERRAAERMTAGQERLDRRAAEREAAAREREASREARRTEQASRLEVLRPDSPEAVARAEARAAVPKRRSSGALSRTGEARIERDTRGYRTLVDERRIRELARRGATISGLAASFGLSAQEIETILAAPEPDAD